MDPIKTYLNTEPNCLVEVNHSGVWEARYLGDNDMVYVIKDGFLWPQYDKSKYTKFIKVIAE